MRPAARTRGLGTSIFTEMSRLAAQRGAVNLGQGFPDFPAPDFVKQAAIRAIAAEKNQYAPAPGIARLRQRIAEHFERRHGRPIDPDTEVTVTAGATEALCDSLLALVDPGDEVVVFEPSYDAYVPDIRFAGAVPRAVTLRPPSWDFDERQLAAAFGPRTRAVVVNTPHNPTGKVFRPDELDAIARLCVQHDAVAICDEVYSELTYDGSVHCPLALRPGMAERTVTIDSMGKTFSVTGWKIGWAIAAPALTESLRAVHQFVTFCISTPLQEAAADAMEHATATSYYDVLRKQYDERRQALRKVLAQVGLQTLPTAGAYFLLADFTPFGFTDDTTFCRHLIDQIGVAAIPTSAFYLDPSSAPPLARFCFAKQDATMQAAAERLVRLRPRG